VKGNKKRAEAILTEKRRSFQPDEPVKGDILFADFMGIHRRNGGNTV